MEYIYVDPVNGSQLSSTITNKILLENFTKISNYKNFYFFHVVRTIIETNGIDKILIKDNIDVTTFTKFINEINTDIEIIYYQKTEKYIINISEIEKLKKGKILLFIENLTLGAEALSFLKEIKKINEQIICFCLHTKKNVIRETSGTSADYMDKIKREVTLFIFYESGLPYYLFRDKSNNYRVINYKLKELYATT